MKFPVLWSGLCCLSEGWGGKCSEILATIKLLDNPRVNIHSHSHSFTVILYIPEFLKTGLAKIRAHFTTWQLKAIKSVQRPIEKPISDAEQ